MQNQQRTIRLRQLVSRLNKTRRLQEKKIDILCNDLISAHRSFIKGLRSLSFAADFYESIIGKANTEELLRTATYLIKKELDVSDVVFFLRRDRGFELFGNQNTKKESDLALESYFSTELIDNICKSNALLSLNDMLEMGLDVSPAVLSRISAFAMPLSRGGTSAGFILIYRFDSRELTISELKNITSITTGLAGAVAACTANSN